MRRRRKTTEHAPTAYLVVGINPREGAARACACACQGSYLKCMVQTLSSPPTVESVARDKLRAFIADTTFPCVGAKSALNKGRMRFREFGQLGGLRTTTALHAALMDYSAEFPDPGSSPVSFVALFDQADIDEQQFEALLWKQLQSLHVQDLSIGHVWNSEVSASPERHDFSFSVGERAYFVVGMHPRASRLARRSPMPCLVFNFHDQFETLKSSGKYQSMQEAIRARDVALQGTVNPVLSRFGESSEARQYSGRAVSAEWQCPFHHKG